MRNLIFYIIFCFTLSAFAQRQKAGELKWHYTRVSFGPAIGFYGNNNHHAANTRAVLAIGAQVCEEIKLPLNVFFVGGIEYMYNSLMFNSYCFLPNSLPLYNEKYTYNYSLKMNELRLNLLLRYPLGDETRNALTGYIEGGYIIRALIYTHLNVTSNATNQTIYNGATHADYDGVVLRNNFSSALKVNIGLQHNFLKSHKAWFAQLTYMQGLVKFLIHENFTPSALYISSGFLQISLGYKF
jgi:hypothetical protein